MKIILLGTYHSNKKILLTNTCIIDNKENVRNMHYLYETIDVHLNLWREFDYRRHIL